MEICNENKLSGIHFEDLDYQIKIEELTKEAVFLMQYSQKGNKE